MEINKYEFPVIDDQRGSLVSIEQFKTIPFEIKRVYYIYNSQQDSPRGFHAHKELQQILICVSGSCKVLLDDGNQKKIIELNQPNVGLFVDKMIWREMNDFTKDCVLMVLASDYYNENDYIRDYDKFLEALK